MPEVLSLQSVPRSLEQEETRLGSVQILESCDAGNRVSKSRLTLRLNIRVLECLLIYPKHRHRYSDESRLYMLLYFSHKAPTSSSCTSAFVHLDHDQDSTMLCQADEHAAITVSKTQEAIEMLAYVRDLAGMGEGICMACLIHPTGLLFEVRVAVSLREAAKAHRSKESHIHSNSSNMSFKNRAKLAWKSSMSPTCLQNGWLHDVLSETRTRPGACGGVKPGEV